MKQSGRGGKRQGAGRPPVPKEKKAKTYSFVLYDWEVEKVRHYVKILRENKNIIKDEALK